MKSINSCLIILYLLISINLISVSMEVELKNRSRKLSITEPSAPVDEPEPEDILGDISDAGEVNSSDAEKHLEENFEKIIKKLEETKEKIENNKAKPHQTVSMARQVCIKPKDIEKYGLTRGCRKCSHERNYGPGRTSVAYSKVWRDRIMKELAKAKVGQARISAAT